MAGEAKTGKVSVSQSLGSISPLSCISKNDFMDFPLTRFESVCGKEERVQSSTMVGEVVEEGGIHEFDHRIRKYWEWEVIQ